MRAFFECIVNFFTRIGALSLSMAVDIGFLLLVMMLPRSEKGILPGGNAGYGEFWQSVC